MPLYDYKCHSCGAVFEVRQTFSEELLKNHEGCGGELERLISAPALMFKGTGWYVTDYARGGSKPAEGASKSDGKDAAKTDTKGDSTKTGSKPDSPKSDGAKPAPASDSKT